MIIRAIRICWEFLEFVSLRLLLLAKFSENGIAEQRVPERIEPEIFIAPERKRVGPTRRSVSRSGGYRVENRF